MQTAEIENSPDARITPGHPLELKPSRSCSVKGLATIWAGVSALCGAGAYVACSKGIWPVSFFTAMPPATLALCFYLNHRSGLQRQILRLDEQNLSIEYTNPGKPSQTVSFPHGWLKLELVDTNPMEDPEFKNFMLVASASGNRAQIGNFLPPRERPVVKEIIEASIRDLHAKPV